MEIRGIIENSLLEWEGKISTVIFLPRCNFRCPYCHVSDLVLHPERLDEISIEEVKKVVESSEGWIDGVAVTGGEPTIWEDLGELLETIKGWGVLTKIETNGTNPKMLQELIKANLIDFVAMDIKTSLKKDKYKKACGVEVDIGLIKESIRVIMSSGIEYEFRTTVVPEIVEISDVEEIAKHIEGAELYVINQFVPDNAMTEWARELKPYTEDVLMQMCDIALKYVKNCKVRGVRMGAEKL